MPSNCAKCGAELIGSRKFCTACGTPVVDPRSLGSAAAASPVEPGPAAAPRSVVVSGGETPALNPFAVTAQPNTRSPLAPPRSSASGPAPGRAIITPATPSAVPAGLGPHVALSETETDPQALPMLPAVAPDAGGAPAPGTPSVSPLAVSGLLSANVEREAVAAAREEIRNAEAASKKIPGTQMMPSSAAPRPDRTHLMPAVPLPQVAAPSAAQGAAPPARGSAPSTSKMPVAPASAPASGPGNAPDSGRGSSPPVAHAAHAAGQPPRSVGYAPPSQVAASARPPWAGAPYSAQGPYAPFGYAPGSRVLVTWATGQRFPATVQQVTPAQCLVMFDNGQQQWVDVQYVAPA
jgi:hypothetical protein